MLTYNSSDIIKRAAQLADLENSDFISWNENMNLLNEAYRKLYQKVIDHNDKYYYKKMEFSSLVMTKRSENEIRYQLPCDFYQLASIQHKKDCQPINRKANSEAKNLRRYDIINDEIVLYGSLGAGDIDCYYYPTPATLCLTAPDKSFDDVDNLETMYDCNGNKYLSMNMATGNFELYDIAKTTKKVFEVEHSGTVDYALLGKKVFVIVYTDSSAVIVEIASGNYTEATVTDTVRYGKAENEVYMIQKESNDTWTLYRGDTDNFSHEIASGMELTLPSADMGRTPFTFTSDYTTFFFYGSVSSASGLYKCVEGVDGLVFVQKVSDTNRFECLSDALYAIYYDVTKENDVLISDSRFASIVGFNKADDDTGYGISGVTEDGELVVFSFLCNTELSFPNNFYFNYLAYMLAIAYKAKQNADYTALANQAASEEFAFFDTLNRDVSQYVRINNVYANGGY